MVWSMVLVLLAGLAVTAGAGTVPTPAVAVAPPTAVATSATPAAAPVASPADAANGPWLTPDNKSYVRIYRAADGSYQGKIVWLKQPLYPMDFKVAALAGKPKVDRHNPDPKLRSRPVAGLVVLTGFHYSPKEQAWVKGKCYDPEDGKTYNCRMWLVDGGKKLKVRGYVWIFHKTQTWRRYRGPASPGQLKQE